MKVEELLCVNDEFLSPNDERMTNAEAQTARDGVFAIRHSGFVILSSFGLWNSSFAPDSTHPA
jgi:hypothetical protein